MSGICGEVFVVLAPVTELNQTIIYGRNGLREPPSDESVVTEVRYYSASDDSGSLKCDSIEIDAVATLSVILNQSAGSWGAECGSNEKGVCIGLTFSDGHPIDGKLNATDLVRLGLERGTSAPDAIDVITTLNSAWGPQGEEKESAKAAFVICDPSEAWLLNIVGSFWAAQKISTNSLAIKPGLSVGTQVDRSSEDLQSKLQAAGLWDESNELNFSAAFGAEPATSLWPWDDKQPNGSGSFGLLAMFESLRRAGTEKTSLSSHVSVLSSNGVSCHWVTATPNPLESVFKPFIFTSGVKISPLTKILEGESKTLLHKLHENRKWNNVGALLMSLERACVDEVNHFISEHSGELNQELDELMKDCVEAEVKFYR
ncbi:secernin-1 [Malaya genurostris]|uniref:secernin-1 n=1 Tax=Malaya genurostris TaxID=325434 RepID=UPI0026F3A9EF|nr:secernin-1 [Malaya genurostris]XP_058452125.1 secernin-1 [Malaya genurostris]